MAKADKPIVQAGTALARQTLVALIVVVCLTGCVTALFTQDGSAPVAPAARRHNGSAETLSADSSRSRRIVVASAGTVALPVVNRPVPKRASQSFLSLDQFMTILVAGAMSLIVPGFVWLWRRIDESERAGE